MVARPRAAGEKGMASRSLLPRMPPASDRSQQERDVEARVFGKTGVKVPVIGQGTWQIRDPESAQRALRRGIELGMTHIDTAELYTGSEETLAPVIEGRRDDLFLVSKVLPSHADYDGTIAACEKSLKRLQTDHLDVYLLHWWHERRAPAECMRAMGDLIDQGKIRHAGVSNFSVPMMEQAMEALSPREIACNQVLYHLWARDVEVDVLPFCQRHDIALVAYTPFGPGPFPQPDTREGRILAEVAGRNRRTPRQTALRFLTRDDQMFTIPKAERIEHVEENAGGSGWLLPGDDVRMLEEAFPVPEEVEGVPTL